MKKLALMSMAFIAFIQISYCQAIPVDSLYLGQTPPGSTPKVFAPGIVSIQGRNETVITFSPDGTQLFFDAGTWPNRTIMHIEYKNDAFTAPAVASFASTQKPGEPAISPDGKRIYYYAFNPLNSSTTDLCYSENLGTSWGNTVNLGSKLNTTSDEYHPCVVNDSSIYFTSSTGPICRSQFSKGVYGNRVILPAVINSAVKYGDTYVSPTETYMIFNLKNDIYISYKKAGGSWTNPKSVGDKINTSAVEAAGDITPDGKYLTFSRTGDLYWVSASFIDSLKHTNFIPYLNTKIANQFDSVGKLFSYTFPDTTFIDDNGNGTIKYSATLSDGSPLPGWLPFNPTTRTFSGTPTETATLSIIVTATDTAKASVSTTFTFTVVGTASVKNQKLSQNVEVYPNPTYGLLNINLKAVSTDNAQIEIFNLEGKLIFSNSYQNLTNATVDLRNNPEGMYMLKLSFNGEIVSKMISLK